MAGPVEVWAGQGGTWHFLTVPEAQSGEIRAHCLATMRGFKSARVEATVCGVTWRTSIFPMRSGGYFLPLKKQILSEAGIGSGDEVTVEVELI